MCALKDIRPEEREHAYLASSKVQGSFAVGTREIPLDIISEQLV